MVPVIVRSDLSVKDNLNLDITLNLACSARHIEFEIARGLNHLYQVKDAAKRSEY